MARALLVRNGSRCFHRSSWSSLRGNLALSSTPAGDTTNVRPHVEARPYDDIPSSKFFLNINWDMIKNPKSMPQILKKQTDTLGKIFKESGIPGLPPMVFIFDPHDIEKVFRAGDISYPRRFPIDEWVEVRKELNLPKGMFLE